MSDTSALGDYLEIKNLDIIIDNAVKMYGLSD